MSFTYEQSKSGISINQKGRVTIPKALLEEINPKAKYYALAIDPSTNEVLIEFLTKEDLEKHCKKLQRYQEESTAYVEISSVLSQIGFMITEAQRVQYSKKRNRPAIILKELRLEEPGKPMKEEKLKRA